MAQTRGLSVCMIVKNEASNIEDSLKSLVRFADEIIVVDTGSKDNTKDLAAGFTTKIHDFEWTGDFAAARNFAMSKATKSYQLWVDADDRISSKDQGHIESLKSYFDGRKGFYFILENHQPDAPPTSCRQLRCTPLIPEIYFEGRIHEQIFPSAIKAGLDLVPTDIVVTHMGYMSQEAKLAKAYRNLEIMERERAEGRDDGGLHFFLALTYAPLGKREEAVRSMEAALVLFEKERSNHHLIPEGYLFLAKTCFEMEEYDRSVRFLTLATSLVNGNPLQNFQMGIICQMLGKHEEALRAFRNVSGKKYIPTLFPTLPLPNSAELMLHKAYSCYCMNDYKNALELIHSSARQGPGLGRSWEWLGMKAFLLKNKGLAHIAFETALGLRPLEPVSLKRLGEIYEQLGFIDKAKEILLMAKKLIGE